jgi:AcrR family transcriptional regulator
VEAIYEATVQVLRADGLGGLRMAAVARRAGVSVGSIYQYFEGKDALLDALVDRHLEEVVAARLESLARIEDGTAADVLPGLVDAFLDTHLSDPRLLDALHAWEREQGLTRIEAFRDGMHDVVAAVMVRFGHGLRPFPDPRLSAGIIINAFGGAVERIAREDRARLADPVVRAELSRLLIGYLGPLG